MRPHPRWDDDALVAIPVDPPWLAPVCGTDPPDDHAVIYVRLYRPGDGRGFVGCYWADPDHDAIGNFLPVGDVDEVFQGYWELATENGQTPGQIVRWWSGKGNGITYEVTPMLTGSFGEMTDLSK